MHVEETTQRRRREAVLVEPLTEVSTLVAVRRSRHAVMLAAVVCMVTLALVALPAGAALGQESTTTTTTEPTPDTTTTTLPTTDPTTTTVPTTDTTITTPPSTTVPTPDTTTTTIATDPGGAGKDLGPDETLAPVPAFVNLTDTQRAVLLQLQTTSDILATRRFALVGLALQVAIANDQVKAARVREGEAVTCEIFVLAAAAVGRDDATTQALSVLDTSDANNLAGAVAYAQSGVSVLDVRRAALDELARRLESERKSARRARVQAQASVADLNALVGAQTQAATDAKDAKDAAESAAESELGSDAVRPHADGITAALVSAQAGQTDPILVDGLALPIPGAALSSPFGIRIDPLGGGAGFHPGLDIEAGSGTPIHAAAAGVVVMAGDCGGYGNCVVIDHGTSVATVYAHQSEVFSQVGDQVAVGQVIGLVGSTGKSTGPHLHFEVRFHGIPIDPVPTLTG